MLYQWTKNEYKLSSNFSKKKKKLHFDLFALEYV